MNKPNLTALGNYLQLMYFNRFLFERGLITHKEYLSMNERICQRYPAGKYDAK